VTSQVGSAGYFIDLAVLDDRARGRYLLGIECDGASYHSSRTARDRDRLRQRALESNGWKIHRIWSTDWFRHEEREWKRLKEAISLAQAQTNGQTPEPIKPIVNFVPETPVIRTTPKELVVQPSDDRPYLQAKLQNELGRRELHLVSLLELGRWVVQVVQVESPVHLDEIAKRISSACDVQRVGHRIKNAIERACVDAARAKLVRKKDSFLWRPDMNTPPVRDRSGLPAASRKMNLIAPEEIAEAIREAVTKSFGIEREQLVVEVARLFGFDRLTEDMRKPIESCIDAMIAAKRLVLRGNQIVLPESKGSEAAD
jgi:very-short-patch-repair endonuclease